MIAVVAVVNEVKTVANANDKRKDNMEMPSVIK